VNAVLEKPVDTRPPYSDADNRTKNLYAHDSGDVAHAVREWAIANGENPMMRICYCGYDAVPMPENWRVHEWAATGGYSGFAKDAEQGKLNKHRERLFFSPHCREPAQGGLFTPAPPPPAAALFAARPIGPSSPMDATGEPAGPL